MNQLGVGAFLLTVLLVPVTGSYTCEVCDPQSPASCQIMSGCLGCSSARVGSRKIMGCAIGTCSFVNCCYSDCCSSTTSKCRESPQELLDGFVDYLTGGRGGVSAVASTTRDPDLPLSCSSCYDEKYCSTKNNCKACQIQTFFDGTISRSCLVNETCTLGDVRQTCCFSDNCNAISKGFPIPPTGIACKSCYSDDPSSCSTSTECGACSTTTLYDGGVDSVTRSCESSCVPKTHGDTTIGCCYTDNCKAPSRTTKPAADAVSCYNCVGKNSVGMVISDSCLVVGKNTPVSEGCGSCAKSEVTVGNVKTVARSCRSESICEKENFLGITTGTHCCKGHLCNNSPRSKADIGLVAGVTLLLATFARWSN